jgi:hypothetical protein
MHPAFAPALITSLPHSACANFIGGYSCMPSRCRLGVQSKLRHPKGRDKPCLAYCGLVIGVMPTDNLHSVYHERLLAIRQAPRHWHGVLLIWEGH